VTDQWRSILFVSLSSIPKRPREKNSNLFGSKNIAKKKRKIGSLAHAPGRSVLETREQMATSVRKTEYGEQPGEDNNQITGQAEKLR